MSMFVCSFCSTGGEIEGEGKMWLELGVITDPSESDDIEEIDLIE